MQELINQYFDVGFMVDHFDQVLEGFWLTVQLSIVAGILSLIWGLILAQLRQLPGKGFLPIRFATIAYIDVFRGIPLLIMILLISGSIPSLEFLPEWLRIPQWFGKPDNFWFGVFAITITYGAYMAEVYRSGIEAVPGGQMEAARSLGMNHRQAMRNVILPQAVRKVFAPLLNDFIALMKDTTLVSAIALSEVALAGRDLQSQFLNSSGLVLGAIMFLVVTLPLARFVDKLIAREQGRFTRGAPRVEAL
ncbi:MAG TPA: amino acid ABC transporter permease [Solirubrobacterales bacterium]|nr:amino acid ABC transporter permease [Solirubrobacterales bacterium]